MKRKAGKKAQSTGTALAKYQRLEATGLWRDDPQAQRREVVVRMGEATLILSDPRTEVALTHWSLPAVRRVNPGQRPALYAPDSDGEETVEIEDEDMIGALRVVASAVKASGPRPGRLRNLLIGGAILTLGAFAAFVLPALITSHTAKVVPLAKRAEIGQRALDDVIRLTGAPCRNERGLMALASLSERVFGPEDTPILYVLPEGLTRPAHLPGGTILLPQSLLEGDAPDALAGAALSQRLKATNEDPLLPILEHAGVKATFELLTSGELEQSALQGYGEALLRQVPAIPSQADLVAAFGAAQVPLAPYARWLDPSLQRTQNLIDADPFKGQIARPLLPDDDWIALQSVCS